MSRLFLRKSAGILYCFKMDDIASLTISSMDGFSIHDDDPFEDW